MAGTVYPTPATSPGPGLLCLLLEQMVAWSQQKVGEKSRRFHMRQAAEGREDAFVITEAQSWSENLFSA